MNEKKKWKIESIFVGYGVITHSAVAYQRIEDCRRVKGGNTKACCSGSRH
jgi:hypothetical protein